MQPWKNFGGKSFHCYYLWKIVFRNTKYHTEKKPDCNYSWPFHAKWVRTHFNVVLCPYIASQTNKQTPVSLGDKKINHVKLLWHHAISTPAPSPLDEKLHWNSCSITIALTATSSTMILLHGLLQFAAFSDKAPHLPCHLLHGGHHMWWGDRSRGQRNYCNGLF